MTWKPTASFDVLQQRAKVFAQIRDFFAKRNVLEVDTPLLAHTSVPDPFIRSITARNGDHTLYLQTSPEYTMKRLLASGSGCIYQICKAFRENEQGTLHNSEFTMLEWYRLGYDHHALMDEMDELLQALLQTPAATRLSYAEMFKQYLDINPHHIDIPALKAQIIHHKINLTGSIEDKDTLLNLLLSHCIEPHLGSDKPVFIYDFPASQAALAKIRDHENYKVASRFEVYFKGIELANGFHELQNATEQRRRFEKDLQYRRENNIPLLPMDEKFLAALEHGLPDCAGVALGLDRLMMLAFKRERIAEVISFI